MASGNLTRDSTAETGSQFELHKQASANNRFDDEIPLLAQLQDQVHQKGNHEVEEGTSIMAQLMARFLGLETHNEGLIAAS